jgi:hypothetical protein
MMPRHRTRPGFLLLPGRAVQPGVKSIREGNCLRDAIDRFMHVLEFPVVKMS